MEDAFHQKPKVTQEDKRWRQPWLLTVGHDVAVTVVLPELVRDGFQIKINIAERKSRRERGGRVKHSCEECSKYSTTLVYRSNLTLVPFLQ